VIDLRNRRPGSRAALFAEAQALVDDGLDSALVLELYPEEAPWLASLLGTTANVAMASSEAQASYYFEASLKRKFLAAGARKAYSTRRGPVIAIHEPTHRFRTAVAGTALVGAAAAIGVAAIVALRSGDTTTGGGNPNGSSSQLVSRLDNHLNESQAHIEQLAQRASSGVIDEVDLSIVEADANLLAQLAQDTPLDDSQKERAQGIVDRAVTVITAAQDNPELRPRAETAIASISQAAVAAGLSGVTPLTPSATADTTPSVSPSATGAAVTPAASSTANAATTPTAVTTQNTASVATETPQPSASPKAGNPN
jgi:hypothetical protein